MYFAAIRLASLWNEKAAAWINGRKEVFETLRRNLTGNEKPMWIHCSSAGEFEQGKPVIEALKKKYPTKKILVTFFSPSGYAVAKNYACADVVTYLPLDTRKNAERFFTLVKPELVIFVKYEFWYHHLSVAAFHHVPVLLISAVFRKDQLFFKKYGRFFKKILLLFRHIFVQDKASLDLLQQNSIAHCSISGDTRFDRVQTIVQNFTDIPFIDDFIAGQKVIVAGSTWHGDEEVLSKYLEKNDDVKLIIAPHEINTKHIGTVSTHFKGSILYSTFQNAENTKQSIGDHQTLIIDSVGLLSRLYRYATITYVGGGFTKDGIHNILEAAVWRKPLIFGPNYKKYREGKEMIDAGGAFSISFAVELERRLNDLLSNEKHLLEAGAKAKGYIDENTGATDAILKTIQEKRLLTNP